MPYVDFADIKTRLTIEKVAELLGLQLKQSNNASRPVPRVRFRWRSGDRHHSGQRGVLLLRRAGGRRPHRACRSHPQGRREGCSSLARWRNGSF
jgi:hypothetical protein